jgi:hypothetical protein
MTPSSQRQFNKEFYALQTEGGCRDFVAISSREGA